VLKTDPETAQLPEDSRGEREGLIHRSFRMKNSREERKGLIYRSPRMKSGPLQTAIAGLTERKKRMSSKKPHTLFQGPEKHPRKPYR
jgi:hypothetical protein